MPKRRQKLCNIDRPEDIADVRIVENPIKSTSSLINQCLFNRGNKKLLASFKTTNRLKQANVYFKLLESVGSLRPSSAVEPLQRRHKARTCRRWSQKQTFVTINQSHIETRTTNAIPTTSATSNCDYRQPKKTSSSYDGNRDCIKTSNIDAESSKTEWYIELASNCYRNGFQFHVNHLDECSKRSSVIQRKPPQATFLRLPSLALLLSSRSFHPIQIQSSDRAVSSVSDIVPCSSSKSIAISTPLHCEKKYSVRNNSIDDQIKCQPHPHQSHTSESNRINCGKNSSHTFGSSSLHRHNHLPIDKNKTTTNRLPIIDTVEPIARQSTIAKQQFNVLNVRNNNMTSVAVDANHLQQNPQLSCQTIQYNYHQNNNLTFKRDIEHLSGQQEPQTIGQNNIYCYQQPHWINENTRNPISLTNQCSGELRPTTTTTISDGDIVNDLIEAFNNSFDVSDTNQIQLPQIILSDFSGDQPTPLTTPLFSTVQNMCRNLSEHPTHQQLYYNNSN